MTNVQQNYDAGVERAARYMEAALLITPEGRKRMAADIRALKIESKTDHVIEEERGLGEMLIMAIDDKAALIARVRELEAALRNISTGTDIPGYTDEVANSNADCVYLFQDYARAALPEEPT